MGKVLDQRSIIEIMKRIVRSLELLNTDNYFDGSDEFRFCYRPHILWPLIHESVCRMVVDQPNLMRQQKTSMGWFSPLPLMVNQDVQFLSPRIGMFS